MAVGVWKLKCTTDADDEKAKQAKAEATKMLNEWSARYVDIQTVSTAAVGPPPATGTSPSGAGVGRSQ